MIASRQLQRGFALPTILIASVVMLVVLVAAVSASSSVRSALDGQYYNRLAREAAESGVARASACLQDSAFVPQWTSASPLRPNTGCSGGAACTNSDSCFVMRSGNVRTTFTVGIPTHDPGYTGSKLVVSTGKVELLRSSNGGVWRTYTYNSSGRVGVDLTFNTVAFGYSGVDKGAYFATIATGGKTQAVGYNGNGVLGNGTTTNTLTPKDYILPANERVVGIYTNFIAVGYNMFVITDQGNVYGSGLNDQGQLGDGTTTNRSTPVQFGLPAGVKATYVGVGGRANFVLGNDNRIYAVGQCLYGMIGTNEALDSSCTNRKTYKAVNLPTPNVSDSNTLPTSNIMVDAFTAYARMQGGRVYGWGSNQYGQLGSATATNTAQPTQIGTYGNSGQPKANDIEFDGYTIYVLDDQNKVTATGRNDYGEIGGGGAPLKLDSDGKCLNQSGSIANLANCDGSAAQDWMWRTDGTIYSANAGKCLNVLSDNKATNLAACDGSAAQKWTFRDDRHIINTGSGNCLNNKANDNVTVIVYACVVDPNETFQLIQSGHPTQLALPADAGNPVKVATDEWFVSVLTDKGEVWSVGRNDEGQLGNGATAMYQPSMVKFILPAGVKAVDVESSAYYNTAVPYSKGNTFVIGSDGKVYGAGNNEYGQLGDGTTTSRSTPVAMSVIDGATIQAKRVESGLGTTVIITSGRKLYTVGNNSHGQLGDGTTMNSSTPKANRYTNVLPNAIF